MPTLQLPNDMLQIVMERANLMLKESEINAEYQKFETEDLAKNWIIRMALATLITPMENR